MLYDSLSSVRSVNRFISDAKRMTRVLLITYLKNKLILDSLYSPKEPRYLQYLENYIYITQYLVGVQWGRIYCMVGNSLMLETIMYTCIYLFIFKIILLCIAT